MTYELLTRALLNGICLGAIYGVLGMGFSMVYGIVNIPNFAHGVYVMWGMYLLVMLLKFTTIGPYPGFIILFLAFFLFGILTYKGMFKYILDIEHEMQLVFCLGLLIMLSNLATVVFGPTSYLLRTDWLDHILFFGKISLKTGTLARVF